MRVETIAPPDLLPRARETVCRHCGETTGFRPVVSSDGDFCCHGCASVFALIRERGLDGYYACAVPAGVSQRVRAAADVYAVLDDSSVARAFIARHASDRVYAALPVPGLHCASCVWLVERLWRIDPGVVRADVDLVRRVVRVEFRRPDTTLRGVAEALASIGYPPLIDVDGLAVADPVDRRTLYLRLGLAGFAFGNVMLFSIPRYVNGAPLEPVFQRLFNSLNLALSVPVLLYSAAPWFEAAWRAARARAITLDVPVALGLAVLYARSVADIATGRGEGFLDSFSGLVFFLLIGRLFQQKAFEGISFDRRGESFLPLSVHVAEGHSTRLKSVGQLVPDDEMIVRPGEVIPADAVLLNQSGSVDYIFTTGESTPASIVQGDDVQAGGRVLGRALRLQVKRPMSESRLLSLWSDPVFSRPRVHWISDVAARFGWWFTVLAIGLAGVGAVAWWPDAGQALSVATAVLIIACPCALTLAAPITLGTAMSVLSRVGCLLRSPAVALDLSRVDCVAFDKTGTLTTGAPAQLIRSPGISPGDWARAQRLAAESVHPISRALAGNRQARGHVSDVVEVPGQGISGTVDGFRVSIGSAGFVGSTSNETGADSDRRTWIAVDDKVSGWFDLDDLPRPGIDQAVHELQRTSETWLFSGDRSREADRWTTLFGGRTTFGMSPADKLKTIATLRQRGRRVLMVGDGLNDAGALAAADVGMAVADDTACLVPGCDAIIRGDRIVLLPSILRYVRRAKRTIVICFAISIAYNVIGLSMALTGHLTPLATAILMPISSLTVVGLSVGLMRKRPQLEEALS